MNPTTQFQVNRLAFLFAAAGLLAIGACSSDVSAPQFAPKDIRITAAKAASTTDMSVTSTSPDSATQDTTLDVVVNGSGFVAGTSATWSLAGTVDPAQVRTNSTRYVSARQLVANISIAAGATLGKWDVVVMAAGKKGGIGSEAFTIDQKRVSGDSRANVVVADAMAINGALAPTGIRGDARNRLGQTSPSASEYQGDFCGVRGFIYDQNGESGTLDFDADTYYTSTMSPACGAARTVSFFLSGQGSAPTVASPHVLGTAIWPLVVSETRLVSQRFGMQGIIGCGELDFDSRYAGSSNARLTRLPDGVDANGLVIRHWQLESQGNHTAACVKMQNNGKFTDSGLRYYLPFSMSITQVRFPAPSFP
jgi:hypothetical protein